MLVVAGAVTTYPRRAALARVPWLAVSDPKARSALHKKGQIDRAHQASPESATLRSLSERLTLVTTVTGILLRMAAKFRSSPCTIY